MWPQTASRGRFSSIAASSAGLPKWVPSPPLSQWPRGGEWRTRTAPSGQALDHPRRLLVVEVEAPFPGRGRMPAPRPKNSSPPIVVPSPCSTVAALQPAAASRSASVGLVVAGDQHGRRLDRRERVDRLLQPLVDRGEVAGADHHVGPADISTSSAAWPRSRCRSLKASSFTRQTYPSGRRTARCELTQGFLSCGLVHAWSLGPCSTAPSAPWRAGSRPGGAGRAGFPPGAASAASRCWRWRSAWSRWRSPGSTTSPAPATSASASPASSGSRQHGGNPLVSQIENVYYTLNAPAKGGPALKSLPQVGVDDRPRTKTADAKRAGRRRAGRLPPAADQAADPPGAAGRGRLARRRRRGRPRTRRSC